MELKIERIYTKPVDLNGFRILVDRLWPRGISKVNAHLDVWLKEVGPSTELRKWFGHDLAKYEEFKKRYLQELAANPAYERLKDLVRQQLAKHNVILLYGAKDEQRNQAVILHHQLTHDLELEQ
ncbi:DUF488 domain-containing protein [Limosilactobacillus kribbianus]|uniref:DUF488 domain-containing protein n=1 Tax=Limosilactobacillus kribbianus TaxID=2982695 RepID=UPI00226548D3|nr:DUF488 family protein [Limosilactobacillus kribbianus]